MIGDWLAPRALLTPDKIALIDALHDGRRITWREWNCTVDQTANYLHELGVRQGHRVATLAMNCLELLDLWFACGKLGAVLQPLNWRLTPLELAALIDDGDPTVLVYGPDFVSQVAGLTSQRVPGRHFIALDPAARANPDDADFADRNQASSLPPPPVALTLDDPWVICYTGGSTGLPKGAILTHGNILWNSINTVMSWGLTPDDVTFLNAPLFHTGGLNVLTAPLVHIGGTSIICRAFDADQVFDLIESSGVTMFFGVPTMFIALQHHHRWHMADFSRLKWVVSGGAPCPQPVFEKFWARDVEFKTGYGLTEAGPNNFWLPSAEVRRRPGAVGAPLMHVDARVVDADGRACPPEEVGELILRGPHVFAGYWKRPEETARALVDGWLHTGDLARRDADGYFHIAGRLKDLIISGGENIYPAEVESVLAAHPAVAEAAVIGVPDEKWGEIGRAVIVLHAGVSIGPAAAGAGRSVSGEALLEFCRERLGRYKVPRSVIFVEALPRTGAGKVDKQALRREHGTKHE